MLERALSLDATYARAYALLAATYLATWINPLDEDRLNPAALERAYNFAQKAVQLDANLPQAHGELGHVLLFKGQHDLSIAEFERAHALNPNFIHWRHGLALAYAGQPARALDVIKSQKIRDPFYPIYATVYLGLAHFVAKRYADAVPPLLEAINRASDFRPAHLILAATYGRLGRVKDARAEAAHVLRLDPRWTISGTPIWLAPFKHKKDFEHFVESLRTAGLPE